MTTADCKPRTTQYNQFAILMPLVEAALAEATPEQPLSARAVHARVGIGAAGTVGQALRLIERAGRAASIKVKTPQSEARLFWPLTHDTSTTPTEDR